MYDAQAATRAAIAKKIVQESKGNNDKDPRDVLSDFNRNILGASSATLRIPLRDPVELDRHLDMIIGNLQTMRAAMQRMGNNRSALFLARSTVHALNQKINEYKTPRRG